MSAFKSIRCVDKIQKLFEFCSIKQHLEVAKRYCILLNLMISIVVCGIEDSYFKEYIDNYIF